MNGMHAQPRLTGSGKLGNGGNGDGYKKRECSGAGFEGEEQEMQGVDAHHQIRESQRCRN